MKTKLEKIFTRDNGLLVFEMWYDNETQEMSQWIDWKAGPFILNCEDGLIEVYYDPEDLEKVNKVISKELKNKQFLPQLVKFYQGALVPFKKAWKRKKSLHSLKELIDMYDQGVKAWSGLGITYQIPIMKKGMASREQIELALQVREENEAFFAKTDEIFTKTLNRFFPELGDLVKFISIKELRENKIPSKEELQKRKKHFVYKKGKIITQTSFEDFLSKKEYQIVGEKVVLQKEHSREYSLFRIKAWDYTVRQGFEEIIGRGLRNTCAVYKGGDLVSIYYDNNELQKEFALLEERCHEGDYINKEIEKFLNIFENLLPYFKQKKKPKDLKELRRVFDLYKKHWAYVAVVFVIPTLDVDEKLKKMAYDARAKTQKHNESMEVVIKEFLETDYPELKGKTRFIMPKEIFENKLDGIEEKIKQRRKGYVFFRGKLYTGKVDKTLDELGIELQEEETDKKEIKGQIGHKGKVKGIVKLVSSEKDLGKVEGGDILVAAMTVPKYLPAMKKAAAFVTDEGGITCHAAIVSREMGKPCIIGTKIATQVLKDGDKVEVDADKGIVKLVK